MAGVSDPRWFFIGRVDKVLKTFLSRLRGGLLLQEPGMAIFEADWRQNNNVKSVNGYTYMSGGWVVMLLFD